VNTPLVWPTREPEKIDSTALNELLLWAYDREYSDIFLTSDRAVYGSLSGNLHDLTRRRVMASELKLLLDTIHLRTSSTSLESHQDLDFSYEVKIERGRSARFRVNATSCIDASNVRLNGVDITFRVIPEKPPELSTLVDDPELLMTLERVSQLKGLVLVVGETGSGKTTLIAAVLDSILSCDSPRRRVVTWESPIEFMLSRSPRMRGYVVQSEVGRNLNTWGVAVRNLLRRKPDVVLVGEVRDAESMRGLLEVSRTGHLCYSTMHTNSVAAALLRFSEAFPADERSGVSVQLGDALRLVVHQRLLRRRGGGRIAVREWLEFDATVRDDVLAAPYADRQGIVAGWVERRGRSLEAETRRLHAAGLIEDSELAVILAEVGRADAVLALNLKDAADE